MTNTGFFVREFPLVLAVITWTCLVLAIWFLLKDKNASWIFSNQSENDRRQTVAYKRGGLLLLLMGAAGFAPSLYIILTTGVVWSVNQQKPHIDVDAALWVHIVLTSIWLCLVGIQLLTGDKTSRRKTHRINGRVVAFTAIVGTALAGGWVWTFIHDFSEGVNGPFFQAGIYTWIMGFGVAINTILAVVYARRKNFLLHKDHALMILFWTFDPAIHRLWMWLMRVACWDCWEPQYTAGLGTVFAKLPANLFLVAWALIMCAYAGRLNKIIVANVAVQYLFWVRGTYRVVVVSMGTVYAASIAGISLALGLALLLTGQHASKKIASRFASED